MRTSESRTTFVELLRRSLTGQEIPVTRGPIGRSLMVLAIPMMLEMAMESVFALVDMLFVARIGSDAVTVVGLTEAIVTVLYTIAIGLGTGTTAMVARRIGERNPEAAARVTGQAVIAGLTLALIVSAFGIVFHRELLAAMGADASLIDSGGGYTAVLLGGSSTILFLFLLNAVFRGAGDAHVAMRALWLANGINIVLDPCLIFGLGPFPEMGVTGAAVATTIGRGCGVVYQIWVLANRGARIRVVAAHMRPDPYLLGRLVRVSIGGILQHAVSTTSWIILVRLVSVHGSQVVAGYTLALRLFEFTFLPAWGFGNAAATVVGQSLGAGKRVRAERSVWYAARWNGLLLGLVAIVFAAVPEQLIGFFISDPVVIAHGSQALRYLGYGYPFFAVGIVMIQGLNGAGDTNTPFVLGIVNHWFLQLPLAWWLSQHLGLGPQGVWISVLTADIALMLGGIAAFRAGRWKHRVV